MIRYKTFNQNEILDIDKEAYSFSLADSNEIA